MPNSVRAKGFARPLLAAVVGLGLLAAGGGLLLQRRGHALSARAAAAQQSVVVEPRPFASTIIVAGAVTPGDTLEVTAPFDGMVSQIAFEYGAPVRQGQLLAVFDTVQVRLQRDEAEAAYLKAAQAAGEMADWDSGPDVARARRTRTAAALDLQDTQRKAQETKALLDRGLVARSEYDSLVQQQRSQQMALTAADDDLASTLRRGQGANRQVSAIELRTARARLAELDAEIAAANLRSPADGVIVRPPVEKSNGGGQLHAGMPVTHGQLIGEIARAGRLAVAFRLSEADANRVSPGQPVTVTGPGFEGQSINGVVASVGGQALAGADGAGPMASFAASARLAPLAPAQAAVLRIGMTANVVITVHSSPAALVVPPAAVQGAAPAAAVQVRDARSGQVRTVAVRIGQVAPDGVEVTAGLKPGDIVVWTPAADPQAPAP